MHCSAPVDVADGGASGTDVGMCKVHGEVADSLGRPVTGSIVRLRPFDYLAGLDDTAIFKRDVVTGSDGRFTIDSVPAGRYSVECISGDSSGQAINCNVDTADSVEFLLPMVVMPLSTVVGTIPGPLPSGEMNRSVQVIGLERSVPIDSNGNFRLMVPSGWSRLNFHGIEQERPDYDTLVFFQSGHNEWFRTPPQHSMLFCDSLPCEMVIVRELLDSMRLTKLTPESVVVVAGNRVVELRLRARGIKFLPDPVGKLRYLRVLDIGANELHELPRTIEFLRNFRELYIDHNQLLSIPPSIGQLDSLRILDCSFNKLQSLPPTIELLVLDSLNFGDNMLCNLGETTRKWMNAHDPDWRERQICR